MQSDLGTQGTKQVHMYLMYRYKVGTYRYTHPLGCVPMYLYLNLFLD